MYENSDCRIYVLRSFCMCSRTLEVLCSVVPRSDRNSLNKVIRAAGSVIGPLAWMERRTLHKLPSMDG